MRRRYCFKGFNSVQIIKKDCISPTFISYITVVIEPSEITTNGTQDGSAALLVNLTEMVTLVRQLPDNKGMPKRRARAGLRPENKNKKERTRSIIALRKQLRNHNCLSIKGIIPSKILDGCTGSSDTTCVGRSITQSRQCPAVPWWGASSLVGARLYREPSQRRTDTPTHAHTLPL